MKAFTWLLVICLKRKTAFNVHKYSHLPVNKTYFAVQRSLFHKANKSIPVFC